MHSSCNAPSEWIQRWSHLLAPGAHVLDVACGAGRHMRWFAGRGHPTTGLDRDAQALQAAAQWGEVLAADIENAPWPLAGRTFGAVVVAHYLWRPSLPAIVASVAPGGVLLYETFAQGNGTVGRPARADFLLQAGELFNACQGLRVVAYEDGFCQSPDRFVQRITAVRETCDAGAPARYLLPR